MNIAIVGSGYVGLVTGACFAEIGVNVTCVDVDWNKIEKLKQGEIPIYEPGLKELVQKNQKAGRLDFTTSLESVLDKVQVIFSAVGTPPDEDGSADLKYVLQVARTIGRYMTDYKLVVTKSTVPVGTAQKVRHAIQEELDERGLDIAFDVASNPEFLKEGNAISDFMSPDRVVVGVESEKAKELMTKLYKPFLINNFRVIFMDIPSAEMTKYAANSMLATRISFMNDIANLCERVGADVNMVRNGIGADTRIGRKFLYAGCGYGGSCFPKDVKALIKTAEQNGYEMTVLKAVEAVNERQKSILFHKLDTAWQHGLAGKTVTLWGLAFKPETDDMREAPSLVLIRKLLEAGCTVRVYDPEAMDECRRRLGDAVIYARDMYEAALDADALLLAAGELGRILVGVFGEADELEKRLDLFADDVLGRADELERERDVVVDRAGAQQVEVLEDHADAAAAFAQLVFGELGEVLAVDRDGAFARAVEKVDAAHERALAGAGETDNSEDLPLLDVQADVLQGVDRSGAGPEGFVQMLNLNDGLAHNSLPLPCPVPLRERGNVLFLSGRHPGCMAPMGANKKVVLDVHQGRLMQPWYHLGSRGPSRSRP